MDVNRNYESLKIRRTYIGGSREKELETFMRIQNISGECDWFEYRRILFPYLEDILHITFSYSLISNVLSFVFIGFAFLFGLLHFTILSLLILILSVLFRILFIFFQRKVAKIQLSYNISIDIVRNQIKNISGLDI